MLKAVNSSWCIRVFGFTSCGAVKSRCICANYTSKGKGRLHELMRRAGRSEAVERALLLFLVAVVEGCHAGF